MQTVLETEETPLKEGNVLTLRIENDPDIENPEEFDGAWKAVSFIDRGENRGDLEDYFTPVYEEYREFNGLRNRRIREFIPKIGIRRKLRVGTAFMLDYYEHSIGAFQLTGEGVQCPWDTSSCSGILLWEHDPKDMGAKTKEDRAKDARTFLELYNDWMNGFGYWYSIETEPESLSDSCGGFYASDSDGMMEEISDTIKGYMGEKGFTEYEFREGEDDTPEEEDMEPDTLYIVLEGEAEDLSYKLSL